MITLFIILWLICGIIAVWRYYHGTLKSWYDSYKESYWDFDKENNNISTIRLVVYSSPIIILGGLISLLLWESSNHNCWWFTTKNK